MVEMLEEQDVRIDELSSQLLELKNMCSRVKSEAFASLHRVDERDEALAKAVTEIESLRKISVEAQVVPHVVESLKKDNSKLSNASIAKIRTKIEERGEWAKYSNVKWRDKNSHKILENEDGKKAQVSTKATNMSKKKDTSTSSITKAHGKTSMIGWGVHITERTKVTILNPDKESQRTVDVLKNQMSIAQRVSENVPFLTPPTKRN
ncbi:hypothetical protein ACFE04_027885 [Oxalis oulophora]